MSRWCASGGWADKVGLSDKSAAREIRTALAAAEAAMNPLLLKKFAGAGAVVRRRSVLTSKSAS